MYSNYLTEVGKLVYIIGQIEQTSAFKKMVDWNNNKDPHKPKTFFKCMDELPVNAYKKTKVDSRRKGILKCQWFSKMTDRAPMMIFMVFNYCQPLAPNEKWEDRLSITIKKINKVVNVLTSSNKQQIILKVVVVISKQAVLQSNTHGNIVEKISGFLKNYEKELSIFQEDQLAKEINKNKSTWLNILEKCYERKYRAISKRKEESQGERRLGCLIKMAVIAEIIAKKDSFSQYEEAYRTLRSRFKENTRGKVQIYNLDVIRELRTLADIVLLRKLIVKISIGNDFSAVPDSISAHLKDFSHTTQPQHPLFSYENAIWRENFLQNLLEVLYTNDHIDIVPKSYLAQLSNAAISLSYKLCRADKQIENFLATFEIRGRSIPIEDSVYIGSRNYSLGLQILDLDVLWTELNDLVDRKKDYITRGMQTIVRYKSMKVFRKHEVSFFNVYLLRFYLADDKFMSIGNIFNEIIRFKIAEFDFYSLNNLIGELEQECQKSGEHQIIIHSVAILIADYFKNRDQLNKYGRMLMESLNRSTTAGSEELEHDGQRGKQPIIIPLPNQSSIFAVDVAVAREICNIEETLELYATVRIGNRFMASHKGKAILKLFFNKAKIECQQEIDLSTITDTSKLTLSINPLDYFKKDEELELVSAALVIESNPRVHFMVENLHFSKCRTIFLLTRLKVPEIDVKLPYSTYFINETSKLLIEVGAFDANVKPNIQFTVLEASQNHKSEVFMDRSYSLNLVNSGCYQKLQADQKNLIYLKCNTLGQKILKFEIDVTITQQVGSKQLKDVHKIIKQVKFQVKHLFRSMPVVKQSLSGNELKLNNIPVNKKIILNYQVRVSEMINVLEFKQHKSLKPYIKTYKDVENLQNLIITPDERFKSTYIFEVLGDKLAPEEKKDLFLIVFNAKWSRVDMDSKLGLVSSEQIENIHNQEPIKLAVRHDKVELEYEEGKNLKKNQKQTLSIRYRNLTNERIHVLCSMDNTDSILRVGKRVGEVYLGPKEVKSISFQVLPIKLGYQDYPPVRNYIDGLEAKQKGPSGSLCVV